MRRASRLRFCVPGLVFIALSFWRAGTAAEEPQDDGIPRGRIDVTRALAQLVDQETIDGIGDAREVPDGITWKMYVPPSYDPSRPAGLVVHISPTSTGWMPRGWQPVFDDDNLIWISANESGNETRSVLRMLYAVLAPDVAAENYRIDPDRVYLSGFSGGGKMAGMVAIHFANVFRGAIYICGAEFWSNDPPRFFEQVQANRYVFVTGDDDFNRNLTRRIYRRYEREGVTNIKLIIVPGMGHATPDTQDFRDAIRFLNERE